MKINYKNCEIEAKRELSISGDKLLFYNIFTNSGFEITSGFTVGDDTVLVFINDLKSIVDDYIKNPNDY